MQMLKVSESCCCLPRKAQHGALHLLVLQVPNSMLFTDYQAAHGASPRTGILYVDPTSDAMLNTEPCQPEYLDAKVGLLWEVCLCP